MYGSVKSSLFFEILCRLWTKHTTFLLLMKTEAPLGHETKLKTEAHLVVRFVENKAIAENCFHQIGYPPWWSEKRTTNLAQVTRVRCQVQMELDVVS